ncbi:MAG TPA: hypothetical protein VFE62_15100 [Gemmataceae bacterium]|nr:hypothetical protein [Gemmataceae bacterium]
MNATIPLVDLAVVLATDGEGRFLVDFNDNWSKFTFPMSKQRDVPAKTPNGAASRETALVAACRAAAEVLGRPVASSSLAPLALEVPPYKQSGRDGVWKRYACRLFLLKVTAAPRPLAGHIALWLTRAELESLEPISPTVRAILEVLPR